MPLSIKVNLRVTGHCNQGGRKYMEDMFSVAYQQTSDDKDLEYAFFGIFDGHGGGEAATFAKEHLMDIIVKQKNFWSDKDEDVLRAIRDGYVNTHYAMWRELDKWPRTASGLPSTAGTTASIAFIRKGKIYIGHVGDSGIVLGYQDDSDLPWKAKALTKDHKPESGPEMTRIQESGGKVVSKSGVPRVVWNRPRIGHKGPVRRSTHIDEIPFLAVARSLGDLWSYNSELDTFVVSPEPDVKVITVDVKSHRCLIFGTDGLWNMLTPQAAVAIVQAAERYNEKHFIASQQTGDGQADTQRWINPSKSLVDRALERWSSTRLRADNTSVVTLMLDPPGPSRSEVLLNRKKERISSPKCIPTSPVSCTPASYNGNVAQPTSPHTKRIQRIERHKSYFSPERPITPPWAVHQNVAKNDVNINSNQCPSDTRIFAPPEYDKIESNKSHEHDETKADSNIQQNTNAECIQVAEISSSNAIINEGPIEIVPVDDFINLAPSEKEESVIDNSKNNSVNETNSMKEKFCESNYILKNNSTTYGMGLSRENAFSGTCDELKCASRLKRSTAGLTTNVISPSEPPYINEARNTLTPDHYKRRQVNSHNSHMEKRLNVLGVDCKDSKNSKHRRQSSVNNTAQPMSTTSTSYSNTHNEHKILTSLVGSRVKGETPLRPSETSHALESTICAKRRHSSTLEPVEDVVCSDQQEPCSKRRTRSEDQRCPTDENDPINQTKQSQPHNRLRWPNSCSMGSRSRNITTPTTSCQATGGVTGNNQEKLPSPNSFPRRSLEKKATSLKTIRRPSINGSNRVQLRGTFGLRDWDQAKSNRRTSCSTDRVRLNRSMNSSSTESISPTIPQRWLRSDTIAATPIKTLRSRNVDITGHTVPPQIAHQYGIVKPNRISLSAKIKISNSTKVKSPATTLTPSKLKQTSCGNVSAPSVSGSVSGIAKRVKSSPYNLSARSLSTRSRLKRLSK
ncbi:hypothetical protein PV327_004927 [Microctonus hyperodae]|uniref:PPM-type phosphatase domain-containing protein n=1 Tax=Microctonus hyperodae TaxID=165561 RepID=A0AA39FDM4_MICHY|nr:hypothetical protein PV327_004927 [Microctonus hyperodae]